MTGREAIHAVRTMSTERVDALLAAADTDATLRFVCWMRVHDRDGWCGLLRDLGLMELRDVSPKERALALWREDYWTIAALAKETGLSREVLENIRRRTLRGATWATRMAGPHQRAFRLLSSSGG